MLGELPEAGFQVGDRLHLIRFLDGGTGLPGISPKPSLIHMLHPKLIALAQQLPDLLHRFGRQAR